MKALIKWPGGKKQLAPAIVELLGTNYNSYYEPFLGGGSILFALQPEHAVCFDLNTELINMYNVVKDSPEELVDLLYNDYIKKHSKEFFYYIRNLDRNPDIYENLTIVQRAARFLYLNKTCYNGLWRVNSRGQFNVPFGRYKNPSFTPIELIYEVSNYLNSCHIQFQNSDYSNVENLAHAGDLVYFDPPYDIEEGQNGFVNYTENGFYREDQINLKELCDRLIMAGVTVGISNSDTTFIRNLYQSDHIHYQIFDNLFVNRSIGASTKTRKKINELFIVGRL